MTAQSQTSTPNEVDAALGYSQQGIPVFPTNPLDKKPRPELRKGRASAWLAGARTPLCKHGCCSTSAAGQG